MWVPLLFFTFEDVGYCCLHVGCLASSALVDISGSPYKIVDISVFIAVLGQSPAIGRHVQGLTNRVPRVPANGGTYISDGGTCCFDFYNIFIVQYRFLVN